MSALRFLYALYLRVVGLLMLVFGAGYYGAATLAAQAGVTMPPVAPWAPPFVAALGLFLLVPNWLPRGLRRPARGRDLVWMSVFAVAAVVSPMVRIPLYEVLPAVSDLDPAAAAFMQRPVDPRVALAIPFVMMLLLVLPSLRRRGPAARPDANDPTRTVEIEQRRPARLPEKKIPALGGAMKLYIAADWMMLRLMGLGLMATAYMIWTFLQDGRLFQAEALSHGKDPMVAVYIYGGIGAVMAIPFLLPRFIARPQNVFFGLIKAIILVAAAYVLIGPLKVAIVTFTPDMYHATLIETIPRLFKAICGVAVTSALLISFFRQLNGLPPVDYKGDAKITLTQAELYDLRKARMPG